MAFEANYYWVPGTRREDVKVFQSADCLKIFRRGALLVQYDLPPDGTRHRHTSPPGEPKPRHQPRRRREAKQEEQHLRALGDDVSAYLDFALSAPGVQRHRFTRELFALSRQLTEQVFRNTARRAHRYRIVDLATLRRIAWLCLSQEEHALPEPEVDEDFRQRPAYQEGYLTDQVDLSVYDQWSEEQDKEIVPEESATLLAGGQPDATSESTPLPDPATWSVRGDPGSQHIALCESAIDAISCCQLHAQRQATPLGRACLCISTAGVRPDAPWLPPLLARDYQIYCGFDADQPVETASRQMITRHRLIQRLRPPGHDWNDVLTK